jgi:hypothetical protein
LAVEVGKRKIAGHKPTRSHAGSDLTFREMLVASVLALGFYDRSCPVLEFVVAGDADILRFMPLRVRPLNPLLIAIRQFHHVHRDAAPGQLNAFVNSERVLAVGNAFTDAGVLHLHAGDAAQKVAPWKGL